MAAFESMTFNRTFDYGYGCGSSSGSGSGSCSFLQWLQNANQSSKIKITKNSKKLPYKTEENKILYFFAC